MNNWRFLLVAIVAVLLPPGSFTERLFDGRQNCCDRSADLFEANKLHGSRRAIYRDNRLIQTESREARRLENVNGNSDLDPSTERVSAPDGRFNTVHRYRVQERRERSAPGLREYREVRTPARDRNRNERIHIELRSRNNIEPVRSIRTGLDELRISRDRRNVDENRNSNIRTSQIRDETVRRESPTRSETLRINTGRRAEERQLNGNTRVFRRSSEREDLRLTSRLNSRESQRVVENLNTRRENSRERMSVERRNNRDNTERLYRERELQNDLRMVRFHERRDQNRRSSSDERKSFVSEELQARRERDSVRQTRNFIKLGSEARDINVVRDRKIVPANDERQIVRETERNTRRTVSVRRETDPETRAVRRSASLSRIESSRLQRETRTRQINNERMDVLSRDSTDRMFERSRNFEMERHHRVQALASSRFMDNMQKAKRVDFRTERRTNEERTQERQADGFRSDFMEARRNTRERTANVRLTREFENREVRKDSRNVRDERRERSVTRDYRRTGEGILRTRELERTESRTSSMRSDSARNERARESRNTARPEIRMTIPKDNVEMERNSDNRLSNLVAKDRSRNTNSFVIRENFQKADENNENQSTNMSYIFYTLQGAYLCGLLIQMLTETKDKTKSRNFSSWYNAPKNLIKVD